MADFFIKQDDTDPDLQRTLKDEDGNAVDVSGATVRFHMRQVGSSTTKVDSAATISDGANGVVKYEWSTGDTDTAGDYQAEFECTYSDGEIETFPNSTFIDIKITEKIA